MITYRGPSSSSISIGINNHIFCRVILLVVMVPFLAALPGIRQSRAAFLLSSSASTSSPLYWRRSLRLGFHRRGSSRNFLHRSQSSLAAVSSSSIGNRAPHPADILLADPQKKINGVGPAAAEVLRKLGINTVLDLLLHLPVGITDWGEDKIVQELQDGDTAIITVRVQGHTDSFGRRPLTIHCTDFQGSLLDLNFFTSPGKPYARNFYLKQYQEGTVHRVQGKVSLAKYSQTMSMVHPNQIKKDGFGGGGGGGKVEPIYKLTQGLTASKLRDWVREAVRTLPQFHDWLDEDLRQKKGWPSFKEALQAVHDPANEDDLHPRSKARERLAFDELLAMQLPIALRRIRKRDQPEQDDGPVRSVTGDGRLTQACVQNLPFQITDGQERVVKEIWADMASTQRRMIRLLQGDVGSGKTVCAVLAMLRAIEGGCQAALLSPTEILAAQHRQTLESMCTGLSVPVANDEGDGSIPLAVEADEVGDAAAPAPATSRPLRIDVLTSSKGRGKARKALLEELRNGEIDILIGTHSLLSDEVVFRDLGLVVIDEEHRFGVKQREKLSNETNVLYMSATPIPRTLLLTNYGDMEVSRLEELPSRGVTVTTTIFALGNVGQIAERLRKKILENEDEKVFWVLPCIEDRRTVVEEGGKGGAESGVTSVIHRHQALVELLGKERVGMVHGRMDSESKLKALKDFSEGSINVLVSTSVVEVGVDVPGATVCIVEHAEQFGLSQLHQLRGRIGRSSINAHKDCHCVLLYDDSSPNSEKSLKRLMTLKQTKDGFQIAEEDLKLRGPGDLLGNRQSGHKGFRLANLTVHEDLFEEAHQLAQNQALALATLQDEEDEGNEGEVDSEDETSTIQRLNVLLQLFNTYSISEEGGKAGAASTRTRRRTTSSTASRSKIRKATTNKETPTTTTTILSSPTTSTTIGPNGTTTTTVVSSPSAHQVAVGWTSTNYRGDRWQVYSHTAEEEKAAAAAAAGGRTKCPSITPNGEVIQTRISIDLERADVMFVAFDTETTGLGKMDRIIQLAAKVIDWDAAQKMEETGGLTIGEEDDPLFFREYVEPFMPVPPIVTSITGISNEVLIRNRARPFGQVWTDFLDWVNAVRGNKPVILVAHNAPFDHRMVYSDMHRSKMDEAILRESTHIIGMMDSFSLYRSDDIWSRREGDGLPPRPGSFKLADLFRYLYRREMSGAHSAHGDVLGLEAIMTHRVISTKWQSLGSKHVWEMGGFVSPLTAVEADEEAKGGGGGDPAQLKDLSGRLPTSTSTSTSASATPSSAAPSRRSFSSSSSSSATAAVSPSTPLRSTTIVGPAPPVRTIDV